MNRSWKGKLQSYQLQVQRALRARFLWAFR